MGLYFWKSKIHVNSQYLEKGLKDILKILGTVIYNMANGRASCMKHSSITPSARVSTVPIFPQRIFKGGYEQTALLKMGDPKNSTPFLLISEASTGPFRSVF